ncbi:hypothetical protein [Streptomyces sp. NPDC017941]|uniref:hypothetical protein n=1 Tax=unclassified Streptomyces TaxID=2593676 RepID=UPI0037B060A1
MPHATSSMSSGPDPARRPSPVPGPAQPPGASQRLGPSRLLGPAQLPVSGSRAAHRRARWHVLWQECLLAGAMLVDTAPGAARGAATAGCARRDHVVFLLAAALLEQSTSRGCSRTADTVLATSGDRGTLRALRQCGAATLRRPPVGPLHLPVQRCLLVLSASDLFTRIRTAALDVLSHHITSARARGIHTVRVRHCLPGLSPVLPPRPPATEA